MKDETRLISKAKKGDIPAFEMLISTHEKMVYNYCYRMAGNLHDAQDLTQEVFLKAYRSLGSFKGRSQFSTWIYRIAYNTCIDNHRSKKPEDFEMSSMDDEESHMQFSSKDDRPEDRLLTKERQEIIQECINQLRPEYRSAIILRDIQGHSYEEIAKILDIPLGTVKSHISRGRTDLRKSLGPRI
ncbi:MAG: sigma-70 family RNA polymerase sigma factor [Clostridiales bacterium]|nr:sigma-70 family RNA polymerase sigma factor [Clostridiales bacterium]